MEVKFGEGKTEYGPGVSIELTGDEVAIAIGAYLVAHGIYVSGARTITVNGELCGNGRVYVDPSGFVIAAGERLSGRGPAADHGKPMPGNFRTACAEVGIIDFESASILWRAASAG